MKRIAYKVWNYFRASIEGDDHKFSYRRFSQFLFMHLIIVLALRGITTQWEFYTFLVISVNFALTSAILTVQQLITMIKYWSKKGSVSEFSSNIDEQITKQNEQDTESINALDKFTDTSGKSERVLYIPKQRGSRTESPEKSDWLGPDHYPD